MYLNVPVQYSLLSVNQLITKKYLNYQKKEKKKKRNESFSAHAPT